MHKLVLKLILKLEPFLIAQSLVIMRITADNTISKTFHNLYIILHPTQMGMLYSWLLKKASGISWNKRNNL